MFVQTNVHDHHDHRISAECVTCLPCMFLAAEDPLERNFTPASSIHCYMQTVKRSNTYPIPHTPGTTTQTHVISHSQANEFRKNVFVSFSKKCILCLIFFWHHSMHSRKLLECWVRRRKHKSFPTLVVASVQ